MAKLGSDMQRGLAFIIHRVDLSLVVQQGFGPGQPAIDGRHVQGGAVVLVPGVDPRRHAGVLHQEVETPFRVVRGRRQVQGRLVFHIQELEDILFEAGEFCHQVA